MPISFQMQQLNGYLGDERLPEKFHESGKGFFVLRFGGSAIFL
jgi:hypothetical protein